MPLMISQQKPELYSSADVTINALSFGTSTFTVLEDFMKERLGKKFKFYLSDVLLD